MLFPLVGVLLLRMRRREKPLLPTGKTRSVGRTFSKLSGDTVMVLDWIADEASATLAMPFLLSLRLSRIPFALRSLTAGLRVRAPQEGSRRTCAE